MWKIVVGFILFAALSLWVIMKGGDKIDMGGEKHGADAVHAPEPKASAPAAAPAAAVPADAASAAASAPVTAAPAAPATVNPNPPAPANPNR
ncbi:MAG: hypothetical protein ABW051_01020 [Burkholderiaceae bacterium]